MVNVESGLLVPELLEPDLVLKDGLCIHRGELVAVAIASEGYLFT